MNAVAVRILTLVAVAFCTTAGASGAAIKVDPRFKEVIDDLASSEAKIRERAQQQLLREGDDGVLALVAVAAGRDFVLAEEARKLLPRFGPDAIDAMMTIHDLDDGHPRLRAAIASVVAMGPIVFPRMLEIFTKVDPSDRRWNFAQAVIRIAGTEGASASLVEPLIPLLKHPEGKVRSVAADVLAASGDPRAYGAFVEGLESEDVGVRQCSARGLGRIGDRRAIEVLLLRPCRDPHSLVRTACVGALGSMYGPRLLFPIAQMARGDSDASVREHAAQVLLIDTQDPRAHRLARRYRPMKSEYFMKDVAAMVNGLFCVATMVYLGITGVVGVVVVRKPTSARVRSTMLWIAGLGALAGITWGLLFQMVSGGLEVFVLAVVIPTTAALGFGLGAPLFWRHPCRGRFAKLWAFELSGFYGGFAIGWLILWFYPW